MSVPARSPAGPSACQSILWDLEQLRRALAAPLPGWCAQEPMAPFWRRPAPPRADASVAEYRRAAVLILLYPDGDSYRIPLIVRAAGSSPHAGQIGLPGGALEGDETEIAAACREAEEELAIDPRGLEILGTLSPLAVEVSRYTVVPIVARALRLPDFKPAPAEVAAWFSVPLEELLDPANRNTATVSHLGRSVDVPCFRLAGHIVWGATAMALAEFAAVCSQLVVKDSSGTKHQAHARAEGSAQVK